MNAQGWFFVVTDGLIHCYRKKGILGSERLSRIDMGIALCHIASESDTFHFESGSDAPERRGFVYTGTVMNRK
jgi:hypothetical protein